MLLNSTVIHNPKWLYTNHLQTIVPNLYRKVEGIVYERERIETWDDDFIDLDWRKVESTKLIIISHGFEGSSDRVYAKGLAKILNKNGYDVLIWNLRGCSGEDNRQLYSYHSGKTDDLDWVIQHVVRTQNYKEINLIGVSLGGNLVLKYLGEESWTSVKKINAAVAVSVPTCYETSFQHILTGWNQLYERRFTSQVKEKVKHKMERFPGELDYKYILESKNLWEFTARYTVPLYGFKSVYDYNKKVQASSYLKNIKTNTLLINTDNDPLLTKECYPIEEAKRSKYFNLEIPINGGHVGFCENLSEEHNWLEKRVVNYFGKGA
ncbi:MAG: alpha/beta hydrolase [Bacteroidota bacterium]|nr:alpha/beta hydrolase [Bacteroidota bacterium]